MSFYVCPGQVLECCVLLQSRLNSKASVVKMKLVQTVVKCCWGVVDGYIAVFLHMLWCERGMSLKMEVTCNALRLTHAAMEKLHVPVK